MPVALVVAIVKPLLPLFEVKICKAWDGLVVPIPTLPSPLTRIVAIQISEEVVIISPQCGLEEMEALV